MNMPHRRTARIAHGYHGGESKMREPVLIISLCRRAQLRRDARSRSVQERPPTQRQTRRQNPG
jgi:hypothetical protein